MRIMWVTMSAIGKTSQIFFGGRTQSGGWIDATCERLLPYTRNKEVELHIVALVNQNITKYDKETNITYHMVSLQKFRGKSVTKKEVLAWENIIEQIAPDLIQVWGTEFTFGRAIELASKNIPVCFYIQGVMESLSQHPAGDIPLRKLFLQTGIFSIFKFLSMKKEIRSNLKHVKFEAEMIKNADGVILDNEWTATQYAKYTNRFYNVPLALNQSFLNKQWKKETCKAQTIFTVAGGASPIKGIHNVVIALNSIKQKYPNVKLFIPGATASARPHFLYDTIFIRHLKKLIKKYDLQENVCFLGRLIPEQMANQIVEANVFVMPSCVETHSSSLREAMTIGCPSISAGVGSVMEFVNHTENGFIYRYDDVDAIAYYVDKIFSNDEIAEKLSRNSKETLIVKYPQESIGEVLIDAYTKMINRKKQGVCDGSNEIEN